MLVENRTLWGVKEMVFTREKLRSLGYEKCVSLLTTEMKLPQKSMYTLGATFTYGAIPAQAAMLPRSEDWEELFESAGKLIITMGDNLTGPTMRELRGKRGTR